MASPSSVSSKSVEYKIGDKLYIGYMALPVMQPKAGVLIFHEGLVSISRTLCIRSLQHLLTLFHLNLFISGGPDFSFHYSTSTSILNSNIFYLNFPHVF